MPASAPPELSGIIYDVMNDAWRLSADTDVNYIAAASRASLASARLQRPPDGTVRDTAAFQNETIQLDLS